MTRRHTYSYRLSEQPEIIYSGEEFIYISGVIPIFGCVYLRSVHFVLLSFPLTLQLDDVVIRYSGDLRVSDKFHPYFTLLKPCTVRKLDFNILLFRPYL
jgi:hypothetical protein